MHIRYLDNSGFAIEFSGNRLMIIDYYNTQAVRQSIDNGVITDDYLARFESVSVLCSHAHRDHFTPKVFDFNAQSCEYLLSFDLEQKVQKLGKRAKLISPGETQTLNGFEITAFGSTDEGVSFYIKDGDVGVFHAGDFNFWHWKDEADETYVQNAKNGFDAVMDSIQNKVHSLDVAFFPVDPRMGSDYYRGVVLFCKAMAPRYLVPMHFGPRFAPPAAFYDEIKAAATKVLGVNRRGDLLMLDL